MRGADRLEPGTSYGLKHEFEAEGFSITNGQFKGAMLTVGFVPKNEYALNWPFRIHPRWKVRLARGGRESASKGVALGTACWIIPPRY